MDTSTQCCVNRNEKARVVDFDQLAQLGTLPISYLSSGPHVPRTTNHGQAYVGSAITYHVSITITFSLSVIIYNKYRKCIQFIVRELTTVID